MIEIGPFRLDEPARALRLGEREIALQPRVFDLLTYLVKNRERVVSKDELLDNLWAGVTVTDNSIQRAVSSLRTFAIGALALSKARASASEAPASVQSSRVSSTME